jgi:hypothetical protein
MKGTALLPSAILLLSAVSIYSQVIVNFEAADSGKQGFTASAADSAITAIERIADPTGRTTGVLAVTYDGSKGARGTIQKLSFSPKNAHVISILVYLPDTIPITATLKIIGQDNVNKVDSKTQMYYAALMPKNAWVPLNFYVKGNYLADTAHFNPYSPNQLESFSVQIEAGSYKGPLYFDDITLLGDSPKFLTNFENNSLSGWANTGWVTPDGITSIKVSADPGNPANHAMEVGFDCTLGAAGQFSSGMFNLTPDDHVMAFKIWVPADFPDGIGIKMTAQDQVTWANGAIQSLSGADLAKGKWNEIYFDILRFYLSDSTQFLPYKNGIGRLYVSLDNNTSFTGSMYIDDIILCKPTLAPVVQLQSPPITVTGGRTDIKDPYTGETLYYNRIAWTDLSSDIGETYNLYFSENAKITDITAAGVIQISQMIPRATQVFNHRICTSDGAEKTVYYAMTVSGVENSSFAEKPVRDDTSNSGAITAKTSQLYAIPFVDTFNFAADSSLSEFESVTASVPRSVFRSQGASGPKAAKWDTASKDCNFTGYVVFDKSNLYVAMHVIDDNPNNSSACWEGDGFDMFSGLYDVGTLKSYYRGGDCGLGGELGGCYRLGAAVGETMLPHLEANGYQPWEPAGGMYIQKILDSAYMVKFKIPLSEMNAKFNGTFAPEENMILPLKFDINDNDGPDDTTGTGATNLRSMQVQWGGIGNFQNWMRAEAWGAPAILTKTIVGTKDRRIVQSFNYGLNVRSVYARNHTITLSYTLPRASNVRIALYNAQGKEVQRLVAGTMAAGSYNVKWDGTNRMGKPVSRGVYFCRMTTQEFSATRRLIIPK